MVDISLYDQLIDIFRVAVAGVLGAIIGYERQQESKPAQLRDHALVCIGACLFTVGGMAFVGDGSPSRVAANVVTGVGFLGAGAIMRQGLTVRGLTTAASLWAAAAVGLVTGVGLFLVALAATAIVFFVLRLPHGTGR